MKNENVLRSTALLTLSGIAAKTIDFVFRAYYSKQLGSEGLGVFSLCFAVHGIMLNIATGGIGVAVSKIVSEKFAKREFGEVKATMRVAVGTVLVLSIIVIFFTCLFSPQIAEFFLKEPRCRMSIICLSPSVLFMGISYCIKGYFYASRRVFPPASSEFLEQAVKITSITYFLKKMLPMGIEHGCEAVLAGISLGEFSSCVYLLVFYAEDQRRIKCPTRGRLKGAATLVANIALPIMATSMATSFLRVREEVLIVGSLQRSGLSHVEALSAYGGIYGMIMPLVIFPLTLLSSCFTMLVPEISRAYARQSSARLKTLVSKIYRFCTFFGFLVMCIVVTFASEILALVYDAPQLANQLKTIALLCPLMFVDSVSCGILNGMGKQNALLKFSFMDSLSRILLITVLIPKYGTGALLFVIIASNMLTPYLTMKRVLGETAIHFQWSGWFLKHMASALVTYFVADSLFVGICRGAALNTVFAAGCAIVVYFCSGIVLSATSRTDFLWLARRTFSDT
ncbi:MAG: oligosaccharide flippase family protein [Clostridia bacterium]|nr:oligosaccharide flippase family protein [Clostridia bacterium]